MSRERIRVGMAVALATLLTLSAVTPAAAATQSAPTERIEVSLTPDGTGELTLVLTYDLDDDSERQAFTDLEADEQARDDLATRFGDRMSTVAADVSAETGRDVTVSGTDVSIRTEGDTGVVELTVTMSDLAAVDGDQLTVTEPFASGFESDREFRLTLPDGYDAVDVAPSPDSEDGQTLVWSADTNLDGFALTAEQTDDETDGGEMDSTETDGTAADGPGFTVGLVLAAFAVLAGLGARYR